MVKDLYVPFVSEVEEFNEAFNKPNNYIPNIPKKEQWMFVYEFIKEELEEYREACENGDIVEAADAIGDITYVSLGNGVMLHGLKDKIQDIYQEIHESNMSKLCGDIDLATKTCIQRSNEQGEACHIEQKGDYFIVYRTRDLKVMKSLDYFRPDLKKFFTEDEIKNSTV